MWSTGAVVGAGLSHMWSGGHFTFGCLCSLAPPVTCTLAIIKHRQGLRFVWMINAGWHYQCRLTGWQLYWQSSALPTITLMLTLILISLGCRFGDTQPHFHSFIHWHWIYPSVSKFFLSICLLLYTFSLKSYVFLTKWFVHVCWDLCLTNFVLQIYKLVKFLLLSYCYEGYSETLKYEWWK